MSYLKHENTELKEDLRKAREIIKKLLEPGPHAFSASVFVEGKWRHIGCQRCGVEAEADQFLNKPKKKGTHERPHR